MGHRVKASDYYKQTLSDWAKSGIAQFGSAEKYAAQLAARSDLTISGEMVRKWSKQEFTRELIGEMLQIVSISMGKSPEQTAAFLRGEDKGLVKKKSVERHVIQSIYDAEELIEIADWVNDQLRIVMRGLIECDYPETQTDFAENLARHCEIISRRSGVPSKRILEIAAGAAPTILELSNLSKCYIPPGDADRLIKLYPEITPKQQRSKQTDTRHHSKK